MKQDSSRRDFLKISAGSALAGAGLISLLPSDSRADAKPSADRLHCAKGVLLSMLPKGLSYAQQFAMVREAGFAVVQAGTTPDPKSAAEMKKAADAAGIRIDSVMNADNWKYPLSSSDPAVVETGLDGMRTSLHNAKLWGAGAVLLVPGVVNAQTGYREAWTRSQKQIRKLIPLAEKLEVVIAIEEVWNKFLLSPLEMANYIDEYHSPWVQSWFDVGNVVLYGYPQDWIRTLGPRINRLHLKDFKLNKNCYQWVNLGDGAVNWPAVRQALLEIGFKGSATVELAGGNEAYLHDVSQRIDRLLLAAT